MAWRDAQEKAGEGSQQQQLDEKESTCFRTSDSEIPTPQGNGQQLSLDYDVRSLWLEMQEEPRIGGMALGGIISGGGGKYEGSGAGVEPQGGHRVMGQQGGQVESETQASQESRGGGTKSTVTKGALFVNNSKCLR